MKGILAAIGILTPFPLYWWIWTWPQPWVKLCGKGRDPATAMARLAYFVKFVQFICFLSVSTPHWPPPFYFWPLFAFGQYLNIRVYQLLGEAGTYYAVRFGQNIPWVTGFPFGFLEHPQYIGSVLCIVACTAWVPFQYIVLWVVAYAFIIHVESYENPSTRAKPLI